MKNKIVYYIYYINYNTISCKHQYYTETIFIGVVGLHFGYVWVRRSLEFQ